MANTLYDRDFYAWTMQTVKALREKAFDKVDIEHLVEEVESMGKSDFRELKSRLIVLIAHLLKWEYQESQRSTSWQGTIREQRNSIEDVLEDSPSLYRLLEGLMTEDKLYARAVNLAALETEIAKKAFPEHCPYTVAQLLNHDFLPTDDLE
ncbi:DUF29 domain-containing protein [Cysteiniphilum sp. QT6929]|uniref:DUF29 domain-containing protein n=1 Tax=Cysteiniphilum sp. QT6929 TaxID=2975055 RepID=UPI0024B3B01D|nr:DUF29 domain-containing protein [Cysteiniphilum sp. QT6929]WHN64882.1 DUF29 domain-containing protein [Cysteiniphilum sp. QT6929]